MKKDLFGKTPRVGDRIVFNPPKYKGLVYGIFCGYSETGNPKINKIFDKDHEESPNMRTVGEDITRKGYYIITTNFVIVNENKF